jgi:biotin operon repressor
MKKNEVTLRKRAAFIQNQMNKRHKSEEAVMCASRLARELFLSESTIWKDFSKNVKNE